MKFDIEKDDILHIVKNGSLEDLKYLSDDIRDFLVDKVSKTGGHLASNLGIVELTIALHRVYDSPKDRIIFDVGHQSYVHKIITGRAKYFDTLRKYRGLSGFPKARESEHDAYDTGHSSTSVSAAIGMATARDLSGDDYEVVAVIGDGALTGGLVYEAFNNISINKTNVTIVLNDNGMSIAHNVGGMSKHLSRIRASENYIRAKDNVKKTLNTVPVLGKSISEGISSTKDTLKHHLFSGDSALVENLGIKYIGPIDGYDIEELCSVFNACKLIDGPKLVHVLTTKGKGYTLAEKYPRKFHGIGAFNVDDGSVCSENAASYSQIFGETISDMADSNDRIVAIAAAMGTATGLGKFYEEHPDRYFDVGIAEEHAVVFAAGMAKNGYIPYIAIYSSFLQRAFDMIIEDVCLQNLHVVFAIDRAGLVGADGETHHGMFDISYLSLIPNITILAPACGNQLRHMLRYSEKLSGPVAIRYPRGAAKEFGPELPEFNGSNIELSLGEDVQLLAVGSMLDEAFKIASILRESGYSVGISDICVIKPYDIDFGHIKARLVVTIEDNVLRGGWGEAFIRHNSDYEFEILNYGIPDSFIEHGSVSELRKEIGLDVESIAEGVIDRLEGKTGCNTCK